MRSAPQPDSLLGLLRVDESAPWEEVRRAFRDAVRGSHPDLHAADPDAERRVKTLNAAWESVNTPEKWAAYLARPTGAGAGGAAAPPGERTDPSLARLRIHRQRRGSAGLRRWALELDGEVVANVANGDTTVLHARPGSRRVRVFYASCSSPTIAVALRAGHELVLGCRQQTSPLVNLLTPGRALVLEQLESRRFA